MYEYQAQVNRVLDGDTIEVTVDLGFSLAWTTPVRLYGINAPEMNAKDPLERAGAKVARSYLVDLLLGKTVRVQTVKPKDKYGRYLAEVWRTDGLQVQSVNQKMIAMGLVKAWDGQGSKPVLHGQG